MEGEGRQEQKRTGNGKMGGRRERGGQQVPETKRRSLVGNVAEYRESYGGGGAD